MKSREEWLCKLGDLKSLTEEEFIEAVRPFLESGPDPEIVTLGDHYRALKKEGKW